MLSKILPQDPFLDVHLSPLPPRRSASGWKASGVGVAAFLLFYLECLPPPPSPGAQMVRLQGVEKESEGRSWLLNQGWWASQLTQWLIPWTILLRLLNVTSLYAISLHQKGRHSLGIPESIGSQFFLWPSSECDHSSFRRILFRWNSKFPPDLWSLEPLFIEEDHLCF